MIEVSRVERVDRDVVEAFARLVPQLSSSSPVPTAQELEKLVGSDSAELFVARDAGAIVGTLTLVVVRIPTGIRARVEDVVVDEAARGQGVGEALSRAALLKAAEAGAKTVDLTSRPERAAANRLYERLGFERRDTSVYRCRLP